LYEQDHELSDQDKENVNEIKQEISKSIVEAEKYLRENVISMWPEVSVVANQHRTAYSILVHQKHFVEKM